MATRPDRTPEFWYRLVVLSLGNIAFWSLLYNGHFYAAMIAFGVLMALVEVAPRIGPLRRAASRLLR